MKQNMTTDEDIMAYVDGELAPADRQRVADLIARDPAMARKAALFAGSAKAVAQLQANDSAPADVMARLRRQIGASPAPAAATVVPFPRPARRAMPLWSGAVAASLTLAVGLGGGLALNRGAASDDALFAALDSLPSGQALTLADGRIVQPVATFQTGDGALCREYETVAPAGQGLVTIACAGPDGWDMRLIIATDTTAGYAPASAPDLLDAFYAQIAAQPPQTLQEEAASLDARRSRTD